MKLKGVSYGEERSARRYVFLGDGVAGSPASIRFLLRTSFSFENKSRSKSTVPTEVSGHCSAGILKRRSCGSSCSPLTNSGVPGKHGVAWVHGCVLVHTRAYSRSKCDREKKTRTSARLRDRQKNYPRLMRKIMRIWYTNKSKHVPASLCGPLVLCPCSRA